MDKDMLKDNNNGTATCRICGVLFVPSDPNDRAIHKKAHLDLARGGMPQMVRDFSKAFGWAVAHNDGGLDRLKGRYDPELGKLVVAFSWWSRARSNGASEKDFDVFMSAHLRFADALVANDQKQVDDAARAIKPWERYAG